MDPMAFVASLVSSLAWPVVVLLLVYVFRSQVRELLTRLRSVKALGAEGTFDPKDAEASVALATAQAAATVATQETTTTTEVVPLPSDGQLTERFMVLANSEPNAAVLAAYAEVERALKRRMMDAKVAGVEKLAGSQLVDVALRKGVINRQTAEAIRGIQVLRNLAAHGREDVTLEKALDYLSLADAVLYTIEVGRVFATTATGTATAYDATVKVEDGK